MAFLLFNEGTWKPLTSQKLKKCSYLPQMLPDPKSKSTLFSSTLKVEDEKVLLFFQFEVNLVSYGDFEFLSIWPFLDYEGYKHHIFRGRGWHILLNQNIFIFRYQFVNRICLK